jgi:hypothetical protein
MGSDLLAHVDDSALGGKLLRICWNNQPQTSNNYYGGQETPRHFTFLHAPQ